MNKRLSLFGLTLATLFLISPVHALSWIEQNQGQARSEYGYVVRANDLTALISPAHIELLLTAPDTLTNTPHLQDVSTADLPTPFVQHIARLTFEQANPLAQSHAGQRAKGMTHYLSGSNQQKWLKAVPHFETVRVTNVYDGIDVVYRLHDGQLEYDFIVAPNSDPSQITLSLSGATTTVLDEESWQATTPMGLITQTIPAVYQQIDGNEQRLAGRFRAAAEGTIQFELQDHDVTAALVIDPVIEFSGYFGGNRTDRTTRFLERTNGAYLLSGTTTSLLDFISNPSEFKVQSDVFVAELDSAGDINWVTVFGGSRSERAENTQIDSAGNIVVVGNTESSDFPTLNALQSTFAGGNFVGGGLLNSDGFVAKLAVDGQSFVFATYLGGTDLAPNATTGFGFEFFRGLALDASDNVYVAGQTAAPDFPVTDTINGTGCFEEESQPQIEPLPGSASDIAIAKISPTGSLLFSACLGGSFRDAGRHIQVDDNGDVYLSGFSRSSDFPTTPGVYRPTPLIELGFNSIVVKLSSDLSTVTAATFVGDGFLQSMDVDADGNIYGVTATSEGLNETTAGVFQPLPSDPPANLGDADSYVFKLSADATQLIYGTYLGALGNDFLYAIKVDDEGRAYVAGNSSAPDYPLRNPLPASPQPYLINTNAGTAFDSFNGVSRDVFPLTDNNLTYNAFFARDGLNYTALGDVESLGLLVPLLAQIDQYDTSAIAFSANASINPLLARGLIANRDGVNQLFSFDENLFTYSLFDTVGSASEDSRDVVTDILGLSPSLAVFLVANYGSANTLVEVTGTTPGAFVETSVGRTDGNTTAFVLAELNTLAAAGQFVAVANELQDIRLYDVTNAALGPAIVLNHSVGTVSDIAAGDLDGDGTDELVVVNADSAVEVLTLNDAAMVSQVVVLTEANADNLSAAVVDVDGDNDLDVIIGRSDSDKLYINDGTGTLSLEASYVGALDATLSIVPSTSAARCPCFSTTNRVPQEIWPTADDVVVSVLSADGSDLEFSTRLKGGGEEELFTSLVFAQGSDSKVLLGGATTGDLWPQVGTSTPPSSGRDALYMVLEIDQDQDNVLDGLDNCERVANPDQRDTNDDGFGNLCDADLNNDNIVNFVDVSQFASVFGSTDEDADFNGDGAVNFLDLVILREGFLLPPGPGLQ
ncbi:MAG: SBBP repeat-containing protein [Pseudomonadota bacterium]